MSIKNSSASAFGTQAAKARAIAAARRRQAEAKAAQSDRLARLERGERDGRTLDEMWAEINDTQGDVCLRLEGFVLGWLVATGQFEDYKELAEIWLDTPKKIQPTIADGAHLADPLQRFAARLNLPAGAMFSAASGGQRTGPTKARKTGDRHD